MKACQHTKKKGGLSVRNGVYKKYTIKELLGEYWSRYLKSRSRQLYIEPKHEEAVNKILACRTEKLGLCKYVCEGCGIVKIVYQSCKHRFCCTCGIIETNKWAKERLENVLSIKHHHVVMTLPSPLRSLSKMNGDKIHNLLFKTSAKVVKNWFKLRHEIDCGIVSVLHTSGSDLKYHPHVHMIVSGGGLTESKGLTELQGDWLCQQHTLGKAFRKNFQRELLSLYDKGGLKIYKRLTTRTKFLRWLNKLNKDHWIVSIQKPLEDVEQIIKYVGRYTKRACISEYKIELVKDDKITIRYNDYKNTPRGEQAKQALLTLDYVTFFDELFQHVPNKRFRIVRYYGIYHPTVWKRVPDEYKYRDEKRRQLEKEKGEQINQLYSDEYDWGHLESYRKKQIELTGKDPLYCSHCKRHLILYEVVNPTAKKTKKVKKAKKGKNKNANKGKYEDSS